MEEIAAVSPEITSAPAVETPPQQMNLFSEMAVDYEKEAAAEVPEVPTKVEAAAPAPVEIPPSQPEVATQQPPPAALPDGPRPPQEAQPPAPAQVVQQGLPTTEQVLQRRREYLEQLARQYSIPEDQVDILATEPHKVLPNMAANIAMNTYEAITQYFNSMMPQYILHTMQQHMAQRQGTDRFYEQWPQLRSDDPNVMKTVSTIAMAYRRANPTASVDEAIDKVGAASSAMLGLPVDRKTVGQPPTPRTPSAKPFSHSAPGLAGPSSEQQRGTPAHSDNFFSALVNGLDLSEL